MDLGESGQAIWKACSGDTLDAVAQSLVLELARCADTCDRLDGLAAGRQESWVLLAFDDMGEIHLQIDRILELRIKHQQTLKALFAEVRAAKIEVKAVGGLTATAQPEDMLAALRKQKEDRERQSG